MAILRRKLSGRGIGEGDRGHIHHRLQDRGLTRIQTLIAIAGLCVLMTTLTVLSAYFESDKICLGLCLGLLALLIVSRVFGHHEALLFARRAQRVGQLLMAHSTLFGRRQTPSPATWDAAVELARPFGVTRMEFVRIDERTDAVADRRTWADPTAVSTTWELRVSSKLPVGQRITIVAFGDHRISSTAVNLADLFLLLDECCRGWAAGTAPASEPAEPIPTITRPAPRPRLLPAGPAEPLRKAA
jgi:hypothetical protein